MHLYGGKKGYRFFVYIIILALVISLFPINSLVAFAATPVFTMTPAYTNTALLPTTVVVTSNQASTFTPGSCYPSLIDSGNKSQAVSIISSTSTSITFTVPKGLANGSYSVRIGDPKGNQGTTSKYYLAGTFIIQDPLLTGSTPYKSLPMGYDSQQEISVTGQYTHFSMGQTTVELLNGTTVVQNASVVSVTAGSNNTQILKFKVNTGLAANSYKIRITTGDEIVEKLSAITVRNAPAITLGTKTLTAGYSTASINITGTNTGFDETTQVSILDSNGDSTGKSGSVSVTNTTALSFTVNTGLVPGTYTVKVKTGVEEATAALIVTQPTLILKYSSTTDTEFSAIGKHYADTNVKLIGTNTHFASGSTQLFVFSGSTDVTSNAISGTPSINGQTISFTLKAWTSALGETLKIRAVTGEEQGEMTLSITEPAISLYFNSAVANGTSIASGYKNFRVDVTGTNTHFRNTPIVQVRGQSNKTANLSFSNNETALSFDLVSGLSAGTYYIDIDVDGNVSTNDTVSASFTVTAASSIAGISPNPVLNNGSTPVVMTVTGSNTHFTAAASKPQVDIVGAGATIQNVNVINDTSLTFELIPNSISSVGDYGVRVVTEGSSISETAQMASSQKLQVNNQGISTSPSKISELDLGNKTITVAASGFSFDDGDGSVAMSVDGQSITLATKASDKITFKLPKGIGSGIKTISVTAAGSTYNSSITVLQPKITSSSPSSGSVKYGYTTFPLTLTGNESITFNQGEVPQVQVDSIAAANVIASTQNNTLTFDFPSGLAAGTHIIGLAWNSGSYAGNSITFNYEIKHEIDSLTLWNGSDIAGDTLNMYLNSNSIPLTAKANVIGVGIVDITTKAVWTSTNESVVSVTGGVITPKGIGTATVTASYDGYSDSISITVLGPSRIDITAPKSLLLLREKLQLSANAIYADGSIASITSLSQTSWSSTNNSKAAVNVGEVRGVAEGTATITASYFGKQGTFTVTVSSVNLVPSFVSTVELGNKDILVTGIDISGISVSNISINVGGAAAVPVLSGGNLTFKVPKNLSTGAKTVNMSIGAEQYTASLEVRQSAIIANLAGTKEGYAAFDIILSGSNVVFDDSTRKPIVKVGSTTINSSSVLVNQVENKVIFPFPTGKTKGTHTIELSWTSGPYSGNSITTTFEVVAEGDAVPPPPIGGTGIIILGGGIVPEEETLPVSKDDSVSPTVDPDKIAGSINKSVNEIESEKDPAKAKQKAVETIKNTSDEMKALADKGVSTTEVEKALQNIAVAALDKVNDITVKAQDINNASKAVISKSDSTKIIAQMDAVQKAAKELNDQLAKSSTGVQVKAVIEINVESKNTKQAETVIPTEILKSAAAKNIDLIEINTGIATIAVAPDAITASAASTVSLSAKILEGAEVSKIIKGAVGNSPVYDFSALTGTTKVSTFNKPVEVTVPYALKTGEKAEKITVYYIAEDGKIQNVIGMYDEKAKTVKFKTNHFSKYAVVYNNITFKDLGSVQWAKDYIETLGAKGIAGGNKGNFRPTDSITRSQFTAMVVRSLGLKDDKAVCSYKDVKSTHVLYKEIASAYKLGILVEKTGSSFRPDENITREEMAQIIANVLTKQKGKTQPDANSKYIDNFKDKASVSASAKQAVALANKYGMLQGGATGNFNPKGMTSRAAAAKVIYLLLKLE